MSKAPHPKTPLRLLDLNWDRATNLESAIRSTNGIKADHDAGEAARAEARQRYFRDPIAQADLLWERLAATAEDARARRFWFRGPLATVWAWLRGEL